VKPALVLPGQDNRTVFVGGVESTHYEVMDCVRMLCNRAKDIAGEAHGKDRSEKFRANWPDENNYAIASWKNCVQQVINEYAAKMDASRLDVSDYDKRRMFIAVLMWQQTAEGKEKDNRLQFMRDSQQFEGDKHENKKIADKFGKQSNSFIELAMGTSAIGTGVVNH
jgi:hypothetical protein